MQAEFDHYDGTKDSSHPEMRLHLVSNHLLSFNYFTFSSAAFQELYASLAREKAAYYAPPPGDLCIELVLIRTKTEGEQTVYRVYDKATGEFRLSALYFPEIGEYAISTSKSVKHIQLFNDSYVGGIRSNLLGTGFTIFDFGVQNSAKCFGFAPAQTELAVVSYGRNLFGWEPREFSIAVPKAPAPNQGSETLMSALDQGQKDAFTFVYNKPPKWNEQRNTYTLDFRNKVKKASKKNFILETEVESKPSRTFLPFFPPRPASHLHFLFFFFFVFVFVFVCFCFVFVLLFLVEREVMMMGKIETDTFHLHYYTPFSLVVTFGIALSSFHKKMLVK